MPHEKFDSDDEISAVKDDTKHKEEKKDKKQQKDKKHESEKEDNNPTEDADVSKRKRKRKRKKKSENKEESTSTNNDTSDNNVNKLDSLEHTVFVEGIPFVCKEEEIKNFFVSNGCPDVIQMRLPTWQDSGRLRGFGHIVFDTTESRNKAIEKLNGLNLKSRYLNIQEPKPSGAGKSSNHGRSTPRTQPDKCRTVFVRNMPYRDISEDDIKDTFRSCGKIMEGGVRLARNYSTRELKGFGYIEFKNPEGAFAAVQRAAKGGIILKGRTCYVDYEEGAMKGSFRKADGKLWQKEHGSVHDDNNAPKRAKR